ncbi:MAG: DUF533 domain-containing protein [Tunicatimonas sp.]
MDFQKKGWLRDYIQTRNHHALHREYDRVTTLKASPELPEKLLYELIQPTGLLYGYPTQLPYAYKSLLRALNADQLPPQNKNKVILLESLLYSALTSERYQQLESEVDVADAFLEAAFRVGTYYKSVYHNLDTKYKGLFFYRERRGLDLTEYILDSRTDYGKHEGKFWTVFINSSLLFIDILLFNQWMTGTTEEVRQEVAQAHEQMRTLLLKTMIVAAYANHTIEKEEERLLAYYQEAALLSEEMQARGAALLKQKLSLDALELETISSPVLKKYLLELAVLVVSADNIISKEEEAFIGQFRKRLGLPKADADASILTVESFMYAHWQNIGYARHRDQPDALRQHLLNRITRIGKSYKKTLQSALAKDHPLLELWRAGQRNQLRTQGKKALRQGLLDLLAQLPVFTPNTVPSALLTYSVLLEVLPKDLEK